MRIFRRWAEIDHATYAAIGVDEPQLARLHDGLVSGDVNIIVHGWFGDRCAVDDVEIHRRAQAGPYAWLGRVEDCLAILVVAGDVSPYCAQRGQLVRLSRLWLRV